MNGEHVMVCKEMTVICREIHMERLRKTAKIPSVRITCHSTEIHAGFL